MPRVSGHKRFSPFAGHTLPGLKLVVIIILSLPLMMFDHAHGTLSPVRNTLEAALEPARALVAIPHETVTYLERYLDRGKLIRQNNHLQRKLKLQQGQLQKLAALESENERLHALMGAARSVEDNVLMARILSISPKPYHQRLILDKGSRQGVYAGQTLIDAHGVVGQVSHVSAGHAHAMLITDPSNSIPVAIDRTGQQTIAQGTGRSGELTLPFLPRNADIKKGDLLTSSGMGQHYPAHYPVARVAHVNNRSGEEFLEVKAQPVAHLDRGREVLLIRDAPTRDNAKDRTKSPEHNSAAQGNDDG